MKKLILMLALFGTLFTSCQDYYGDEGYEDEFEEEGEFTETDVENLGFEGSLTLYKITENNIDLIKDYDVPSDYESFQADKARHNQMWDHVTSLIPLKYRDKISEFEVFHGDGGLLGYVVPIDADDLSKWRFGLAIDMEGDLDKLDFDALFTRVVLHEYGHVLTLNNDQVQIGSEASCDSYFTGEGCSFSDSYIDELYRIGWADIIENHDENDPEKTYEKYTDRFVSDYAATNPGEDIAEVFTFFVASESKPASNSGANKKIAAMYKRPRLMKMREEIRDIVDQPTLNRLVAGMENKTFAKFRVCGHKNHK